MNRGARRGPIFERNEHCLLFLDVLASVVSEFGWEVHAWSLMPNHYHLLVRSVHGNLSECMKWLGARYTRRLNDAEGWDGPTFRGRFRSELVGDEKYLRYLVAYIQAESTARSTCLVIDAQDLAAGPVATLHMPYRVPYGFHAGWVAA